MYKGFSEINDFPVDFRQNELNVIFGCIERSQSIQIIGATGSGKSILLKALSQSEKIKRFYLKEAVNKFDIVLIDLKFSLEKDLTSVLQYITSRLSRQNTLETTEITSLISNLISGGKRIVIVFDSFDQVPNPEHLFTILKAIYDENRGRLSYIFSVSHEVDFSKNFEALQSITSILTENKMFIGPLVKKDFEWFIGEQENYFNQKLTLKEKLDIYNLTGGYMATAKRIIESIKEGFSLKNIKTAPEKIERINYHFQILLKDLHVERDSLSNLIIGKNSTKDETNLNYLKRSLILNKRLRFNIPLFKTYLENINVKSVKTHNEDINNKIVVNAKLTASEFKILKYLCDRLDQFCSRDEIIEGVWGEKSIKGISDHALDQIVYRLRKKLEKTDPQLKIETIWGRGHKAVLVS